MFSKQINNDYASQLPQQLTQNIPIRTAEPVSGEFIVEDEQNFDLATCNDELKLFETPKPITGEFVSL